MVGIILLAGLALLPPMLQNLFGYPVVTTGMVLAPRGVGTMISMIVVGRLVGRVDARILIFAGLSLTAYSLWQMTGFSPAMDWRPLVVSGVVQGLGLGLVFVPLSTLAFATLEPRFRAEAAALFSLVRNIGSSVGISIVATMLAHNMVAARSDLVSKLTPYNPNLDALLGRSTDVDRDARPAQRAGAGAGGDDRLRRRLHADDLADARGDPADPAAAQARRARRRRPRRAGDGVSVRLLRRLL